MVFLQILQVSDIIVIGKVYKEFSLFYGITDRCDNVQ